MPVADHEVHDKVKHDKPTAGCFNRRPLDRKHGYWVYVRKYFTDGNFMMNYEYIEDKLSKTCRQVLPLPECEGCTSEKDEKYLDESIKWK